MRCPYLIVSFILYIRKFQKTDRGLKLKPSNKNVILQTHIFKTAWSKIANTAAGVQLMMYERAISNFTVKLRIINQLWRTKQQATSDYKVRSKFIWSKLLLWNRAIQALLNNDVRMIFHYIATKVKYWQKNNISNHTFMYNSHSTFSLIIIPSPKEFQGSCPEFRSATLSSSKNKMNMNLNLLWSFDHNKCCIIAITVQNTNWVEQTSFIKLIQKGTTLPIHT